MEFPSFKNNLDFLNLTDFGRHLKVQPQGEASYTKTLILTEKTNITLPEQESSQTPIRMTDYTQLNHTIGLFSV